MKKWLLIIVIFIVIIGGGSFFYIKHKQSSRQTFAQQTQTSTVQKGSLKVTVSGSGTVKSASSKDVTSDTMGTVDEVLVSKGDKVKKGDELVTFTDGSDPITAPNSGTVTSLNVESGDKVNQGKVVAHITNYSDLETTINVDELDINKVKKDQDATITLSAIEDKTFKGKVTDVAQEGTSTNGVSTFEVTVSIENPKDIKVGMTTEANIVTANKKNVVYVPVDAVHTNGTKKYVVVKNSDGSTSMQAVKVGINNDDNIEITSGLTVGQEIVLPTIKSSSSSSSTSGQGRYGGSGMGGMSGGMQGFSGGMSGGGFRSGGASR
ncbi:efflux RND transporter periplasmic adaptor subunit [Heyndrickxia ginsengihumi]|uniref:efflux RND transporter periplasmic adaptor subunit n=1 Tax=Heyndrickxia ginsengihumi TaxID=363870 RepID=UPI003D219BB8